MHFTLVPLALFLLAAAPAPRATPVSPAPSSERFMAPLPADGRIKVRKDLAYESGGARLAFDVYLPASRKGPVPVVVFVNGIGAPWMRGHVQYTGWGRAVTARGLAGVVLETREASVDEDLRALLRHLREQGSALGVDGARVALWACSANVRRGLPLAVATPEVTAAVVYYGHAEVAAFRPDLPVLFVRAGLDAAGLNRELDALVAQATRENVPVELLNVPAANHAFDIRDDAETSRAAIARTLDFLERVLSSGLMASIKTGVPLASASGAAFRGDWKAAVAGYEAAVKSAPLDALLWQRVGEARRETGDAAGARAAFEKALELGTPNRGVVAFALLELLVETGQTEEAVALLEGMKPWIRFFAEPIRTGAKFESFRKDPRVAELLAGAPPPPK
ncbi:dienelactone hydrolase [Archangium gephyra]|uniref:Dienelactone hydrolase n=1 Tax=Archangium gephyra TaxID=48 RepID=A0AAC8Q263_9BACT|nr:tetratricopeptide repeat protein [Archangium gephyra]AKI99602.1 Hypothetical protein AA314_01229 [Archangium gephyra]REG27865.1 dienelactone hydrolase [Archangium gephyra]